MAASVLSLGVPGAPAVAQDAAAPTAVTNQTCPVTPGEVVDPEQFVETDVGTVFFCCARCRRKYERDPDQYSEAIAHLVGVHQDGAGAVQERAQGAEHAEHDDGPTGHSHAEARGGVVARAAAWLGKSHPPSTHFPIAMLLAAATGELVYRARSRELFAAGARFCLWIGVPGAVAGAVLGWLYAGAAWSDGDLVMTAHRWLGTATAVLAVAALAAGWRRAMGAGGPAPRVYLVLLCAAGVAAAGNGFLGGLLVYGVDHYAF
jgi:uncharacterized membrane protein